MSRLQVLAWRAGETRTFGGQSRSHAGDTKKEWGMFSNNFWLPVARLRVPKAPCFGVGEGRMKLARFGMSIGLTLRRQPRVRECVPLVCGSREHSRNLLEALCKRPTSSSSISRTAREAT